MLNFIIDIINININELLISIFYKKNYHFVYIGNHWLFLTSVNKI
jgi:hypothetical protein